MKDFNAMRSNNIYQEKQAYRNQIKAQFAEQKPADLQDSADKIITAVTHFLKKQDFSSLLCYHAFFKGEIDIQKVSETFAEKNLFLPTMLLSEMTFMRMEGKLSPNSYGIPEPMNTEEFDTDKHLPAIALVPGMLFDNFGNRIGRGLGFYDRFLGTYPEVLRVGIAHSFQIKSQLPFDTHDQKLHYLITEEEIYQFE